MNKSEQVSSDGHQMSLTEGWGWGTMTDARAGGWWGWDQGGPMSDVWGQGQEAGTVRPNASWVKATWEPPVDRHTYL